MSTNTIDWQNKVAILERQAANPELDKYETEELLDKANYLTKVSIGTREAKPAPFCERMEYLDMIYGTYKESKNKRN